MRFSILGPLEIHDDDGGLVAVSRRLHRWTLNLLLLNAGQPCAAADLIGALWGDEPPLSPDVSLRSCVYGIRKLLPDSGRLQTHPAGYLIKVAPGELDLHDFRGLAQRGREALDADDPATAASLLTDAVGLWREPPLADLPAAAEKQRLLDQLREAQDALMDARLALGRHRQVLAELRAVVGADPLREHAWAQLMLALYRCGARAEALAAFGRLRMTLVTAYGIEPGPELQDLHRQVLADDPALMTWTEVRPAPAPPAGPPGPAAAAGEPAAAGVNGQAEHRADGAAEVLANGAATGQGASGSAGADGGSVHPAWQPAYQLPAPVADFTGRGAEIGELLGRLSGEGMPVTVLTGMLGAGKTVLAVHAAHLARPSFPDGQLYACLDDGGQPRDPQVVLGELLRGLGVPPHGMPAAGFEREALYRSVLAERRVLVLADGASSAAQVRPLLPGTAGCAVLVTSRARLAGLDGARVIEIGGLPAAEAASLVTTVSGRLDHPAVKQPGLDGLNGSGGQHDASGRTDAALRIAAACGYLPLALRMAGARLAADPGLGMADLAGLLADEDTLLDQLVVGEVSVRARFAAAAQLAGDPDQPAGGRDGAEHYPLHPLVRAYARELLAEAKPGVIGSATGRLLASTWLERAYGRDRVPARSR